MNDHPYEEKLSAYLDGRLSPEEAADIASHIEACSRCAHLLEQMRRVEDMAGAAMSDFDEDILDRLEQRIRDGIDEVSTFDEKIEPKRARIIPIWYRYVAVAASVLLVFLVGRMAFKDTDRNIFTPNEKPAMNQAPGIPSMPSLTDSLSPAQQDKDTLSREARGRVWH